MRRRRVLLRSSPAVGCVGAIEFFQLALFCQNAGHGWRATRADRAGVACIESIGFFQLGSFCQTAMRQSGSRAIASRGQRFFANLASIDVSGWTSCWKEICKSAPVIPARRSMSQGFPLPALPRLRAGRSHMKACERLAMRVPRASRGATCCCDRNRVSRFVSHRRGWPSGLFFLGERAGKKYNRFTMEIARQLQCKALRRREKSRRRNNNGKQWKKQCAEQWKRADVRARADASPGHIDTPHKQIARRREAPDAHVQD